MLIGSHFLAGLRSFFKSFFKKKDPLKVYGMVKKKLEFRSPGRRLWEDNDVGVDCGETLSDGSTNIVGQWQAQTNNPALKKIKSTHAKIVTQRVFPHTNARELEEDLYKKLK